MALPRTLSEALPDEDRIKEAYSQLSEAGVKYVFSCWIDLLGLPKTKPVPIAAFENLCRGKGPQFAVHSVSMFPELGPADPDQIPIPDLDSLLVCPWDKTCAWVFADLWMPQGPYNVCPRLALKRQVQAAAEAGYRVMAGVEPEFYAMRYIDGHAIKAFDNDLSAGQAIRPRRQAWGYDAEASIDSMRLLGDLINILEELGWGVKDVVTEGGYSQFELDFGYTDILKMADRFTFLRVLIKEVAKRHGLFVTFMPKPTTSDWRSGAHINHSMQLVDRPGVNVFEDGRGGWSELTYHVVAGLLRHGAALTAVACSTVNSYKGLVARVAGLEGGTVTWAPTHMTFGMNNRSAMLRLPQSRFAIENRATDMCMNAYLAMAVTTAASVKGIREKMDPGPPLNRDLYEMTPVELSNQGIQRLPRTLVEAIEIFDRDELVKEVFGPVMHQSYSRHKHAEWDRFHAAVTEWEVAEYLRFY